MINKIQADCPKCGRGRARVVCTRREPNGVTIRRRNCIACGHRWYSIQYPEVPVLDQEIKWMKGDAAKFCPITSV